MIEAKVNRRMLYRDPSEEVHTTPTETVAPTIRSAAPPPIDAWTVPYQLQHPIGRRQIDLVAIAEMFRVHHITHQVFAKLIDL